MKSLLDFIPLIVFYVLYKKTDKTDADHPLLTIFGLTGGVDNNHILVGTLGLVLATILVYGYLFVSQKFRLEKQQWFVLAMTIVFGGLTLALSDDYYIRLKAVLINLAFGLGIAISPIFTKDRKPVVKKLFDPILNLNSQGWVKLNLAWAGLFIVMAGLHGFFAFVFMGGEYWGDFAAFGDVIVMMTFMAGMFVVLRKHFKLDETAIKK
ncbi:septation protein IspZ [Moraxella nasovis]|uniref:inner membrane-spanning protein YciB n=1 Tax=Moraxella nasovis TaxID=2904121 RepID=UPI001F60C280|nr:septation protein IspZ [Moraxella nasovis]UNU73130.1 septation protein IspZ [Moraxella nasovis]